MFYFLLIATTSCISKVEKTCTEPINFNDTVRKTHISLSEGGDTIKHYQTFYFSPVDQSVDTSSFFYTACKRPCSDEGIYKIYFPRKKVIEFCDSMINSFLLNPNSLWDAGFVYNAIRVQAAANENDEVVYADELTILLDRFRPLIWNHALGDKPNYIIIELDKESNSELKCYYIKTTSCDTIILNVTKLQ